MMATRLVLRLSIKAVPQPQRRKPGEMGEPAISAAVSLAHAEALARLATTLSQYPTQEEPSAQAVAASQTLLAIARGAQGASRGSSLAATGGGLVLGSAANGSVVGGARG